MRANTGPKTHACPGRDALAAAGPAGPVAAIYRSRHSSKASSRDVSPSSSVRATASSSSSRGSSSRLSRFSEEKLGVVAEVGGMVGCRRRRTELLELRVVRESQFCRRTATCPHPSRTDRARGLRHNRSPDPRSNHSHPFVSDDDIPCSGSSLHRCTSATAPWWWKSIFSPAALNSTCSENRAQLEMDTDSAPTSSINSRRRASSQFSANSGCPPGRSSRPV